MTRVVNFELELTVGIMREAQLRGSKTRVFKTERWHDDNEKRSLESKFFKPKDISILMEICQDEKLRDTSVAKTLLSRLTLLDEVRRGRVEVGLKCPEKLDELVETLRLSMADLPGKILFSAHSGPLLPYVVCSIHFNPYRRGCPASTEVSLKHIRRGSVQTSSIRIYNKELKNAFATGASAQDLIESNGYHFENDRLRSEYATTLSEYERVCVMTGEQFWGFGKKARTRSYWEAEQDNGSERNPVRCVVDDKEERRGDSLFVEDMWFDKKHKKEEVNEEEEGEDKQQDGLLSIPVHPFVRVFNLKGHSYFEAHISNLKQYEYDADLIHKLILPSTTKEIISILLGASDDTGEDVVSGKGGGTCVLCSGPAGVGKTLTSEVFAEAAKRPLYVVQCSQLGLSSKDTEECLEKILERAARWRAILLLDEADVYIHERGEDMEQNAIVGVFLRLLEYYHGVLFMNTNRATVVDDAIASRCIAHIRYELPDNDAQRTKLWTVLSRQFGVELTEQCIAELIVTMPNLSGRTIKQLLKLGKSVAAARKTPVDTELLKYVSQFQSVAPEELELNEEEI